MGREIARKRLGWILRLVIVLVGFGLFALGTWLSHETPVNRNFFGTLAADLGAFVGVLVLLQWLFDEKLKRELILEVADRSIGVQRIADSGLIDLRGNAADVVYNAIVRDSDSLVVGQHYSRSWFTRHRHLLEQRAASGKPTILALCDKEGVGVEYLRNSGELDNHIDGDLDAIATQVDEINALYGKKIEIIHHQVVLRYSFVLGTNAVWIKPYKNSKGRTPVPAFCVERGGPLFKFYEDDICRFQQQAGNAA